MQQLMIIAVLALNLYALLLIVLRAVIYRVRLYRPMVLNLALSFLPMLILAAALVAFVFAFSEGPVRTPWLLGCLGLLLVWLLLLPNSSYLITELNFNHRRDGENVPLWYDIVSVLSLAMSGVLNTVVSVYLLQLLATIIIYGDEANSYSKAPTWIAAGVVLLLVSVGMYLGRYLRFYSWDLVHPIRFLRRIRDHFREPGALRNAILFCVLHTVFLSLIYACFALAPMAMTLR